MANKKLKVGNVPNLRFPGFEGEWETKKLGEINIINPKNENLPSSFIYIDLESVINGRLLKEERILKDEAPSRAQRRLVKGDILFQMVRPYQKNNLYFDKEGDYVASTGYAQIRTLQNSQFIFQYLHNQKFVDKVIERCTGTSYPAINSSDLGNIKIHYPNSKEQSKISKFLELLDSRIQTQNKIIRELNVLKTNAAKSIFSQDLRFKDENGNEYPNWEIKKLEEILVKFEEKTTLNNQYPILTSARTGLYFQKDYFDGNEVASKNNIGYNIVPREYFTYRHMSDDTTFKFNINNICDKGIVSTLYPVFTTKNANSYFLKTYLNEGEKFKNYALLQKQGGSRTYMYFNKLIKLELLFPCLIEQSKIANFLLSIDSKIDVENQLLQKLEEQKKFLLHQMFV